MNEISFCFKATEVMGWGQAKTQRASNKCWWGDWTDCTGNQRTKSLYYFKEVNLRATVVMVIHFHYEDLIQFRWIINLLRNVYLEEVLCNKYPSIRLYSVALPFKLLFNAESLMMVKIKTYWRFSADFISWV